MEHSARFELVRAYYRSGAWSAQRVLRAVGAWITEAEAAEILGGANDD